MANKLKPNPEVNLNVLPSSEVNAAVVQTLSAAAAAGILMSEKTLGDVIKIGQGGNIGTLGHAVAWDRYVLVVA